MADTRQAATRSQTTTLVPAVQVARDLAPATSFRDVGKLDAAVRQISDRTFLLSPVARFDFVPEFHEASVRMVVVNPDLAGGEVYVPQGAGKGEVALTKASLDKIAAAAGISWDPLRSGRLDDGSDPHYCHYRAVGFYRDVDGSRRVLTGEKEVDLRDGNPSIFTDDESRMGREYDRQAGRYTNKVVNKGYAKGWSAARLAQTREHILAMAESKAKNRAIRSLGVKQKYNADELRTKPFAVVALVLTGQSDDPELRRMARSKILDASLAASRDLYGPEPLPQERNITPAAVVAQVEERHAPPPLALKPPDDPEEIEVDPDAPPECGCPDAPAGKHEGGCPVGWS